MSDSDSIPLDDRWSASDVRRIITNIFHAANQPRCARPFELGKSIFGFDGTRTRELFACHGYFGDNLCRLEATGGYLREGERFDFETVRRHAAIGFLLTGRSVAEIAADNQAIGTINFASNRASLHIAVFLVIDNIAAFYSSENLRRCAFEATLNRCHADHAPVCQHGEGLPCIRVTANRSVAWAVRPQWPASGCTWPNVRTG